MQFLFRQVFIFCWRCQSNRRAVSRAVDFSLFAAFVAITFFDINIFYQNKRRVFMSCAHTSQPSIRSTPSAYDTFRAICNVCTLHTVHSILAMVAKSERESERARERFQFKYRLTFYCIWNGMLPRLNHMQRNERQKIRMHITSMHRVYCTAKIRAAASSKCIRLFFFPARWNFSNLICFSYLHLFCGEDDWIVFSRTRMHFILDFICNNININIINQTECCFARSQQFN